MTIKKENKFRALDSVYNKFVYSNGYYFDGINYWFIIPDERNLALAFSKHIQVLYETIGQFSGKYDKNDIEIYEDDILARDGFPNTKVRFCDGRYYPSIDCDFHKIIGNIHENPKLIDEV